MLGRGCCCVYVQLLILSSILILMGFMTIDIGLQVDIIATNRKLLEDIQFRVRKMEADADQEK